MRRHHVLILIVAGVVLVLAIMLVVGFVNGGDAGDEQDQPPSGLPALRAGH